MINHLTSYQKCNTLTMKYSNVNRAISTSLFLVKAMYCASYPVTSANEQIVTAALYYMTMNCPHNCSHYYNHQIVAQYCAQKTVRTVLIASFPGPAQVSVTCSAVRRVFHTASDGKLDGAWERGYSTDTTLLYVN